VVEGLKTVVVEVSNPYQDPWKINMEAIINASSEFNIIRGFEVAHLALRLGEKCFVYRSIDL
jgi:hypothetical protein